MLILLLLVIVIMLMIVIVGKLDVGKCPNLKEATHSVFF